MISPIAIRRVAHVALRRGCSAQQIHRRSMATETGATETSSTNYFYESSDVAGIKVATREAAGPITNLAIVVKAGTRYEPAPGLTSGLEQFAFKNTEKRSALRITRETELLGGELRAHHTRECLVLEAKSFRKDLPYFMELLSEVISLTKYTQHEFAEEVTRLINTQRKIFCGDVIQLAVNSAHGLAFHRGLGTPVQLNATLPLRNLTAANINKFAVSAYSRPNIAVVANGASQADVSKWVEEFFTEIPPIAPKLETPVSKYHGGEERISHGKGNVLVIAFPGSSSITSGASYKPEMAVLAALLGGESSIKWSTGFSLLSKASASFPNVSAATTHHSYSDAGLLTLQFSGSAQDVRSAAAEAVKILKTISNGSIDQEDFSKAVALAKHRAIEEGQDVSSGLVYTGAGLLHGGKLFQFEDVSKAVESVSADKLKSAAGALMSGKATVAAVGDLHVLPYAEEIGLNV